MVPSTPGNAHTDNRALTIDDVIAFLSYNKTAVFWDEVLDLPGDVVPNDAIIQVWRFWNKGKHTYQTIPLTHRYLFSSL